MTKVKKTLSKEEMVEKLMPRPRRNFEPAEVLELQELNRIVNTRKWEAAQVKANTALVPRGQEVADEMEAIARLVENAKNLWVSNKLVECGYDNGTKCNISFATGEITLQKEDGSTNS